jgi:uncharacterized membrane protein YdbT with pleckstrin-like domain
MKFKVKRDTSFTLLMIIILIIVDSIIFIPTFFVDDHTSWDWMALVLIAFLTTAFLIWIWADIRYEMREDYLFVKGGPFRSRIAYNDITRITMSKNIWFGYRLLASMDAIEIHYKTGLLGSVKISPEEREVFIEELKKRNPSIKVG